jgi:phosphate transport system permease protein
MRQTYRTIFDRFFTILTGLSVVLLIVVLLVILGPMLWRGFGAVVFDGTVEFRKMQLAEFGHGSQEKVRAEAAEIQSRRQVVYNILDEFKNGIDTEQLTDRAKSIYRDFGKELQRKDVPRQEYTELRSLTRELRNRLIDAFESTDK